MQASPAVLGWGFVPWVLENLQLKAMVWHHPEETKEVGIAIVQARNDGAGEKGTWIQPNPLHWLLSNGLPDPFHSLRCPGLTEDAAGLTPLDQHCP